MGKRDPHGAKWHRWDPHIHAPGTVMNDQYTGTDPWNDFLSRVEKSAPQIRALGITDYYSVDVYEQVLAHKANNRLAEVDLVFPNIEMRYNVGTGKAAPINVHLLVNPNDPKHVAEIRRLLSSFKFRAYDETFHCTRDDLIKLGKIHDRKATDERRALEVGANQFKVSLEQLRDVWDGSAWMRDNVLIAVSAGSQDGTSGIAEASLAAVRKEIEKFSHIIFSGTPKQRQFWIGEGAASVDELNAEYGGCKPCLHGSDAHRPGEVGAPDLDRLCWVKGDVDFEALVQGCLEPADRTYVGKLPPRGAFPSQVIEQVSVTAAPWLKQSELGLNAGLVAIIGPRGSGKTALADMIAAGGYALSTQLTEKSFVRRAKRHLADSAATLTWEDGSQTQNQFANVEIEDIFDNAKVQYLSQQFVDTLCSAEGVTDELLAEIERVIYQAHPAEDRMGTTTFRELLDLRAEAGRHMRATHEVILTEIAEELNGERDRRASLPGLQKQREEKTKAIEKDKKDRATLITKDAAGHSQEYDTVSQALEQVRGRVEQARRRRGALQGLQQEVVDIRTSKKPQRLRTLKLAHAEAGLSPTAWQAFDQDFVGNVDDVLNKEIDDIDLALPKLLGVPLPKDPSDAQPSKTSVISAGARLEDQTLALLDHEASRLQKLIGIDAEKGKQFERLSEKISRDEAALAKLDREIEQAKAAEEKIKELIQERRDAYGRVFDGILAEETQLASLYNPLKDRLATEPGALGKLTFSIRRKVDAEAWAEAGEELLNLRNAGPFRLHGTLLEKAKAELVPAWTKGSSKEVAEAMARFRENHESSLVQHMPDFTTAAQKREWGGKISAWLYSTDHIELAYSAQYEGADIGELSPGTRGIVLLLLYLAIDRDDDRPLIIDQPEENLDPKSINDELVGRFRRAKQRRQIIIVTHNANLVVNADADQVIVASSGPHRPDQLPEISYESGGLENADIRTHVINILEGGDTAFKERARRLRVRF